MAQDYRFVSVGLQADSWELIFNRCNELVTEVEDTLNRVVEKNTKLFAEQRPTDVDRILNI